MIEAVVFDWGDTVMRVFPHFPGPMASWPRVEAMPGAEAALRALQPGYRLALATNAAESGSGLVRQALARVGLEQYFGLVLTARDLGARKPEPAFYAALVAALELQPAQVAIVGDDYEADIEGAKRAGLWTLWLEGEPAPLPAGGQPRPQARPCAEARLRSLAELPAALAALQGRASG
jgi:HAD superfamily hydrolase (TIGR01662 family)